MRYLLYLLSLTILISCGPQNNNDGGLDLTDAQLKELMKRQPQIQNPEGGDAALVQLELNYQEDSSNLDNVYNLGFLYCGKCLNDSTYESCPKAEQYLGRVIRLKADYREGKSYYNRALCLEHQGNFEAALQDLNRFIELNAGKSKPPVNYFMQKAVLLKKMDRTEDACKELKKAEKLDSTGISTITWRSACD